MHSMLSQATCCFPVAEQPLQGMRFVLQDVSRLCCAQCVLELHSCLQTVLLVGWQYCSKLQPAAWFRLAGNACVNTIPDEAERFAASYYHHACKLQATSDRCQPTQGSAVPLSWVWLCSCHPGPNTSIVLVLAKSHCALCTQLVCHLSLCVELNLICLASPGVFFVW